MANSLLSGTRRCLDGRPALRAVVSPPGAGVRPRRHPPAGVARWAGWPLPRNARRLQPLRGDLRARADHRGHGEVTAIRGNPADPLSRGHICPKGVALGRRATTTPTGCAARSAASATGADAEWVEIGWDEALDLVADGLAAAINEHGANALGVYLGNPNAHSLGSATHGAALLKCAAHAQPVQRHLGRPAPAPVRRAGSCSATSCCSRSPTSTARRTSWSSGPTRWPPTAR